ncbi:hypothetical protein CASFOL_032260 [Castilleja foliolosa]|uniref:Uncharacterized protein n=1 Tax=Castilleja foliolosa TaxID=1961234 RepID=A0ABD3C1K3_9LAMI
MDDGDAISEKHPFENHPLLRRRKSSSTSKLSLSSNNSSSSTTTTATSSSSSFPSDDMELLSIKSASRSYTSLKDLLPTVTVNSPKPNPAQTGPDICIRNRLVKQAAWAYLQPMSTSPSSAGDNFLHRLWPRVAVLFDFLRRSVIRAVSWTLTVFSIRSSR